MLRPDEDLCGLERMVVEAPLADLCTQTNGTLVSGVERDLVVEERSSVLQPSTADELKSDWIPRCRSKRRMCDSEESVRVVEEVEGLMEMMKDLDEDLVWEGVEGVGKLSL